MCLKRSEFSLFKSVSGDFPGDLVAKTLPSNAGRTGSIPGWGIKIPHAKGYGLKKNCAGLTKHLRVKKKKKKNIDTDIILFTKIENGL